MKEVLHSHITVNLCPEEAIEVAKIIKGKATVIHLENKDREQQDVMITNYYVIGYKNIYSIEDAINHLLEKVEVLRDSGYDVVRWKMEYENPSYGLPNISYYEVHIRYKFEEYKLDNFKELGEIVGWRPSRNPYKKEEGFVTQFLNNRFSSYQEMKKGLQQVIYDMQCADFPSSDIKTEAVILDSNLAHDKWWL